MSVFERLQQRLTRSSTAVRTQDTSQISAKNNSASNQTPFDYVVKVTEDRLPQNPIETTNNLPLSYDHSQTWSSQATRNSSNMTSSCSIPHLPTIIKGVSKDNLIGELEVSVSKSHFSRSQDHLNLPNSSNVSLNQQKQQPRRKRAKTPLSSFYRVSSDEDDSETGGEEEEEDDNDDDGNNNEDNLGQYEEINIRRSAAFERRSQRLRRSIDRAKAALPADFADRIEISETAGDLPNQESSGETQFRKHHRSVSNLDIDLNDRLSTHSSSEENVTNDGGNSVNGYYESQKTAKSEENHTELCKKEEEPPEVEKACKIKSTTGPGMINHHEEESDNTTTTATPSDHLPNSEESVDSSLESGICWHPGPPQPLSEL
ncbi:unnamed protein product, partial [Heterobilharzia americana]